MNAHQALALDQHCRLAFETPLAKECYAPGGTLALDQHCRLAFETAQSQFQYPMASGMISVIVTVNSGYE